MANSSSTIGSNLTFISSSSFSSSSSSSSSDGFHFIHPPSLGSPYISSPEPFFEPTPVHEHWGFEDGLPIAEADWDFEAMDTDDDSVDSAGSYGFSNSADEKISWAPEDEGNDDEVTSALIVSDDDAEETEGWAKWGSSSDEDEDEGQPKNVGWPYQESMDTSSDNGSAGDDDEDGDDE